VARIIFQHDLGLNRHELKNDWLYASVTINKKDVAARMHTRMTFSWSLTLYVEYQIWLHRLDIDQSPSQNQRNLLLWFVSVLSYNVSVRSSGVATGPCCRMRPWKREIWFECYVYELTFMPKLRLSLLAMTTCCTIIMNYIIIIIIIITNVIQLLFAFSALMLFVVWQEGHPACKNFCFKTPWDGG